MPAIAPFIIEITPFIGILSIPPSPSKISPKIFFTPSQALLQLPVNTPVIKVRIPSNAVSRPLIMVVIPSKSALKDPIAKSMAAPMATENTACTASPILLSKGLTAFQNPCIYSPIALNFCPIGASFFLRLSPDIPILWNMFLTKFHNLPAAAFILSQFLYIRTPATTTAAKPSTTAFAGAVTKPITVLAVLNALPTIPTVLTSLPTTMTVLPKRKIAGPTAAAISPTLMIVSC